MGFRNDCFCPEAWENFINQWVFVYTTNDTDAFFDTQWQLRQVQDRYIVLRRPTVDLGGFQTVVFPCNHIVALVEAPPAPPVMNG